MSNPESRKAQMQEEVARWSINWGMQIVVPTPDGGYVLSQDYAKVREQLDAAVRERDERVAEVRQMHAAFAKAESELDAVRRELPTCYEHRPTCGARSGCLICGMQALSGALSQIDYLCGEPNEMRVSGYDVHCAEDVVVDNVRKALEAVRKRTIEECIGALGAGSDDHQQSALQAAADRIRALPLTGSGE